MSSYSEAKVGVLGLGIIGAVWARHFQDDGLLAAAWNRTPQPDFPQWKGDAVEVARAADVIMIVVADPAAVDGVLRQIEPVLTTGKMVVQSSTIDPASARGFADRVMARGAGYLEAPFTGSKPAAELRQTVFYLGGDPALAQEIDPLLSHLSAHRLHMGQVEQACAIKLAMNLQLATAAEALCESITFARQLGLSDDNYFQALNLNAAKSGFTQLKEPKLRTRDYSPQFSIKHMHKDVRLALESGREESLPVLRAVKQRFERAAADGLDDEDFIALIKALEAPA